MLDDGPMDDTVRLVHLYTRWEKRGAEPSFCITSQQVHAFVSSYPPFHSPSLSIHGIFYQRPRLTSDKPGCIAVCSSLALPPVSIPLPPSEMAIDVGYTRFRSWKVGSFDLMQPYQSAAIIHLGTTPRRLLSYC